MYFNFIVLLNLLIAIIGESVEEVIGSYMYNRYGSKCDLNLEISILFDAYLSLDTSNEDDIGVSKTIIYLMSVIDEDQKDTEF